MIKHPYGFLRGEGVCVCVSRSVMSYSAMPGSSVRGILQARVLEWVAISFYRGSLVTLGLNPGFLQRRQLLDHLSYQGSLSEIMG